MKNSTKFDSDLKHKLKNHYQDQLKHLKKKGYAIQKVPKHIKALRSEGEAYAVAYPIQGILKYHGMADPLNRTAFFSSISLNNSSAKTVTYVKLNRNLRKDQLILDGEPVLETDRRFERVKIQLDKIREFAKIEDSNALIISRNIQKMNKKIPKLKKVTGKGIGTSASAGAAIAEAMTCILYDKNPKYTQNIQLKSHFARFLAGSASRSVAGGISIWLNHPKIEPKKSISVRLDRPSDREFIENISIITVSIPSDIKTENVHQTAAQSPFFPAWLEIRNKKINELIQALDSHNLEKLGQIAEYDTNCLHSVTMTAEKDKPFLLWEIETTQVVYKIRNLRTQGIPIFYSIDTGPSVVIITEKRYQSRIVEELREMNPTLNILSGKIAGPSKIVSEQSKEAKTLQNDIKLVGRK